MSVATKMSIYLHIVLIPHPTSLRSATFPRGEGFFNRRFATHHFCILHFAFCIKKAEGNPSAFLLDFDLVDNLF